MQLSAARQAYVPLKDLPVTVHTLCSGDSRLISKGLDGGGGGCGWSTRSTDVEELKTGNGR